MRIYKDHTEVISEIKRDLFEMGIVNKSYSMQNKVVSWNSDYDTKELLNYSYLLLNFYGIEKVFQFKEFVNAEVGKILAYAKDKKIEPKQVINQLISEMKNQNLIVEANWLEENFSLDLVNNYEKTRDMIWYILETWAKVDFLERTWPVAANPWKAWKLRFWVWSEFTVKEEGEEDRKFDYSYSERINGKLEKIIEEINLHPTSRQLIIPIFESKDLEHLGWNKRIPCSMSYQYIIRKTWVKNDLTYNCAELEDWNEYSISIIYNQRSMDFLTHGPIDQYMATKMLEFVHSKLIHKWIILGWLFHNITSLHAYKKDWTKKVF